MAGEKTKEDRVGSSSPGPGTGTRETVMVEQPNVIGVKVPNIILLFLRLINFFFLIDLLI